MERVDRLAGSPEFKNLVADLHDIGETDFVKALCETDGFGFGRHDGSPAELDVTG
jgi:hypothetical protein